MTKYYPIFKNMAKKSVSKHDKKRLQNPPLEKKKITGMPF